MQTDNRRQVIIERLATLMPEPMQPLAMLFAERAVSQIPDDKLDELLNDVDGVPELVAESNTDALFNIARKYGATEDQITQVADGGMPLFPTSVFG